MKKTRTSTYPPGLLNANTFKETFQDADVTLMSPDALRRELATLHKACVPPPNASAPPPPEHPASSEEARDLVFRLVYGTLLHEAPDADTLNAALAHALVDEVEQHLLLERIDLAQNDLRTARRHAPLFLVATAWHVRMANILYGHLYPARVRHWDVDDADSHCFP